MCVSFIVRIVRGRKNCTTLPKELGIQMRIEESLSFDLRLLVLPMFSTRCKSQRMWRGRWTPIFASSSLCDDRGLGECPQG